MKKLLLAPLLAALSFAAPAQAGVYEQGYAGGALYAAACAVMKGRVTETEAAAVLSMVLEEKGISQNYAYDPMAKKVASLMYARNGGCH
jgi:hypothetical protein